MKTELLNGKSWYGLILLNNTTKDKEWTWKFKLAYDATLRRSSRTATFLTNSAGNALFVSISSPALINETVPLPLFSFHGLRVVDFFIERARAV